MTRMQEMSLDYHFNVEQEVGSSTYAFFGFNGEFFILNSPVPGDDGIVFSACNRRHVIFYLHVSM